MIQVAIAGHAALRGQTIIRNGSWMESTIYTLQISSDGTYLMAFFQSHWLCCSIWGSDLWFLLEEGSVEYVSRRLVWQPRWSMRDCSRKEICGWWTTEVRLAPKQVFLPIPPSSSHFFELHKFYSMGPWYSLPIVVPERECTQTRSTVPVYERHNRLWWLH